PSFSLVCLRFVFFRQPRHPTISGSYSGSFSQVSSDHNRLLSSIRFGPFSIESIPTKEFILSSPQLPTDASPGASPSAGFDWGIQIQIQIKPMFGIWVGLSTPFYFSQKCRKTIPYHNCYFHTSHRDCNQRRTAEIES